MGFYLVNIWIVFSQTIVINDYFGRLIPVKLLDASFGFVRAELAVLDEERGFTVGTKWV